MKNRFCGIAYLRSSGMRWPPPCSRMAPVAFPWASSWNSKNGPRGSQKRVSERATRAVSGLAPGFTCSVVPSRRKVAVNPDAALYSPT